MENIAANIKKIALFLIGLLIVLFFYVSYLQVGESDFLRNHPLNRRNTEMAKKIPEGMIMDRHGNKLADSEPEGKQGFKRHYIYGALLADIIGYDSEKYGKAGLESSFAGYLTGGNNPERDLGPIAQLFSRKAGDNLVLTLDTNLQKIAYRALGNHRGAVVAMNPRTGQILAMVSKPSFDPNDIDAQWKHISTDPDSPLLNRAVQGLYPPGSAIKVMMAEEALSHNVADENRIFVTNGSLKIAPDYTLHDDPSVVPGKMNMAKAMAESSNVIFGTIALEIGNKRMEKTFERYGFYRHLDLEIPEANPHMPDFATQGKGDLAQTGIGQGRLLVTPLRMAMLASCFANKGVMMKPYLVEKITAPDGSLIKEFAPEKWLEPATPRFADEVKAMMVKVVNEGTGTEARIPGVSVAGKTGTAQNPHGADDAWFIGFAPADNPQIAVAVIVENAGYGGSIAAPIARQLFVAALH
jgi:peptidoglycan glycosyltransferase